MAHYPSCAQWCLYTTQHHFPLEPFEFLFKISPNIIFPLPTTQATKIVAHNDTQGTPKIEK